MNLETFPSWLLAMYSLKVEVSCGEIIKQKSIKSINKVESADSHGRFAHHRYPSLNSVNLCRTINVAKASATWQQTTHSGFFFFEKT